MYLFLHVFNKWTLQFTCWKLTVCLFYCMVVKSGTCLILICTKFMSLGITVSEKCLMRFGERVQNRFYITAIPYQHLYWLIRERYCFIKRPFVEATLCLEQYVVCILMRFRDFLLHITYCLGIRVTLMLRGPSGLFLLHCCQLSL